MNTVTNIAKVRTLDELADDLRKAKDLENKAKAARLACEELILRHPAVMREMKDEGTTSVGPVKVVTKLSRAWDQPQLAEAAKHIDSAYFPFRTEYTEDRKASKVFEERFPELWQTIAKALTLKPAKPSVSLVEG